MPGFVAHAADEVEQVFLICVGGVAAESVDAGADVDADAVELNIATFGAVFLDVATGCAGGLIADEEDVVAGVAQHGFEVVDDAAATAHAAGGDDDGRPGGSRQVTDRIQMGGMVVYGGELFERQGVPSRRELVARFCIPVLAQLRVSGGEVGCQRGVDDDVQIIPVHPWRGRTLTVAMDDFFQLVEQFLGSPDAERGDEDGALVLERTLAYGLQTQASILAAFMQAVAVGAFHHHDIGAIRRLRRGQQGGVGRAKIAGEDDARFASGLVVVRGFEFDPGGTQDVAGGRQFYAQPGGVFDDAVPLLVGQGDDLLPNLAEEAVDQGRVAGQADLQRVFQHQRQQCGGGFAAHDRPAKTGREQVRDTSDMVDVDMGDDQGADFVDGKTDFRPVGAGAVTGGFRALKQAAVDQHGLSVA